MHLSALQHVEEDYGVGLRRLLLLGRIAKGEYYRGSSAGQKIGRLRIEQLADNWYRREIYKLKGQRVTETNLRVAAKALRQERDQYILGMDALEPKAIKQKKSRTVSFSTALRDLRDSSTTPMEWIRGSKGLSDNE
jgi:hypothetical protein